MNNVKLHAVRMSDVERAANALFDAFLEDPFFEYLFGPRRGVEAAVTPIHAFTLGYGVRYGEVYSPSADIEGVAIWLPPGSSTITTWKAIRAGVLRLRSIGNAGLKERLSFANKMAVYSRYSERLHRKHAPSRHWYLLSIGIRKELCGRGYASALLRPMLDRCDREGVPCYLETHNERNLGLYGHFGFEVKEMGMLPGSSRNHWAMLRNPEGRP